MSGMTLGALVTLFLLALVAFFFNLPFLGGLLFLVIACMTVAS